MATCSGSGRFFKLSDKNIAIMADEKYEKTEDVQQTEEAAAEAQTPNEAETTEKTDAEKLAEAEEEIARLKDRYLRQAAEFDNFHAFLFLSYNGVIPKSPPGRRRDFLYTSCESGKR